MTTHPIESKIKDIIISKITKPEAAATLDYETPLLSLGIDSILAMSIIVEIEEEFNIEVDDEDLNMDSIRNIHNFAELIYKYL